MGVWKNNHGELGIGTTSEEIPIQIQTPSGPLSHVVSISTEKNGTTIVATRDDGSIWRSNDEKIFLKSASLPSSRLQSESPNFLRVLKTADANQIEAFSEAGDSLPDDWQLKYF